MGLWNVPNNSLILGSVPLSSLGVVGALTNLIRNAGNVFGQALATAIVVGVMTSRGFDVPLGDIGELPGAGAAFMEGWRIAFLVVAVLSAVAFALAAVTKPGAEVADDAAPAVRSG
jgi:predicted MFS family arabinose efflux permease